MHSTDPLTGPAIVQPDGSTVTLQAIRSKTGMTRRALLNEMTRHGHTLLNIGSLRNVENGDIRPGPEFLAAWLRALGLDPAHEVLYYPRHSDNTGAVPLKAAA